MYLKLEALRKSHCVVGAGICGWWESAVRLTVPVLLFFFFFNFIILSYSCYTAIKLYSQGKEVRLG